MRNYYILGDWNAICQRCGFKHKASMMKLEWDGLRVCQECFELRHPADLIQVREDNPATPWASPEQVDVFVSGGPGFFLTTELATGSGGNSDEQIYWILTESGLPLLTES
jgi:hypothetical protein